MEMGRPSIRLPRGLRDFPPEEMAKYSYVEGRIRRVLELYGYQEVRTPIFERFDLFALRSGEEIRSRMFVFSTDEGEMALRPELTAPIARMVATSKLDLSKKPLKLYYIGPCYRYDEPQAGRYREFWQAGVELIGSPYPEADAEVIRLAIRVLEELGLKDYVLRIGDMAILRAFLAQEGVPEEVANRIIGPLDILTSSMDKLRLYRRKLTSKDQDRPLGPDELSDLVRRCDEVRAWKEEELSKMDLGESPIPVKYEALLEPDPRVYRLKELYERGSFEEMCDIIDRKLTELALMLKLRWAYYGVSYEEEGERKVYKMPEEVFDRLFKLIGISGPKEEALKALKDLLGTSGRLGEAISRFEEVLEALSWFGVGGEGYLVDMGIIRGLEYYTGMVFEVDIPFLGAQKQVCGGGRYDRLIEEFGGPSLPAVGFAFGIDRLVLAMERYGVGLPTRPRCDIYVVPVSREVLGEAIRIAEGLRNSGLRAELSLSRKRLGEELSQADKLGARVAIIIGPRELASGKVVLRDLSKREQVLVDLGGLVEVIRAMLTGGRDAGAR